MRFSTSSRVTPKAVMLFVLSAASIHASVIYNFVGTGIDNEPMAFQLTVPTFVSPPLNGAFVGFTCGQMNSSTNCDNSVPAGNSIFFARYNTPSPSSDYIQFDASNGSGYLIYFAINDFGATGVYTAPEAGLGVGNTGTLTVSQTPEPTTLLLCLGGFCFYGFRRFANKRSMAV